MSALDKKLRISQITRALPWKRQRSLVPSFVTLGLWRTRQSWRLLLMTWLGVVAAVMIGCASPLFSEVSLTAGLRALLNATPEDSQLALQLSTGPLGSGIFTSDQETLDYFVRHDLGTYLLKDTQVALQVPGFSIVSSDAAIQGSPMVLSGVSIKQAASHLQVLQGRLPLAKSSDLEIVITSKTADSLHVTAGSTITAQVTFHTIIQQGGFPYSLDVTQAFPLRVVGIIASPRGDPFWHGQTLESTSTDPTFKAIMSIDTFPSVLSQAAERYRGTSAAVDGTTITWYYSLDVAHININNLDDLIAHLNQANVDVPYTASTIQGFYNVQFVGPTLESGGAPSSLERFRDRVVVVRIPLSILTILVLGLILAFVSLTTGILVDRQADVIALLRSRGAKRRQIFSAFALQSLGLALIALVVGPLLALLVVNLLVGLAFPPADQGALNIITDNPIQTMAGLRWYAVAAVAVAVVAMLLAIWGAMRRDMLALRREAARSTSRPLWQRLRLDLAAAILALAGYGVSFYLLNSGAIDARTNQVLSLPLSLIGPLCLLIAAVLLFLRFFPLLLRFGARWAARRSAAPPMLALAQVARAPRPALRLILLLSLAISFAVFTLVFRASETQQIANTAAQQTGADFSGPIPEISYAYPSLAAYEAAYRKLPGILAASLGYTSDGIAPSSRSTPLEIRAVDPATFAQAAIWTGQDSSQPLADLLTQISDPARIQKTGGQLSVPAIVDAVAWNALGLQAGATFQIGPSGGSGVPMTFVAVAEMQHLPTVNDSLQTSGADDYPTPGGILVDFNTYSRAFPSGPLSPNYVWLRSSDDPATLAKTRKALSIGPLALLEVLDRRALISLMQQDPFYLALNGMLMFGAGTTLLLALLGSLLASWLNARNRLTNFAVLRALGSSPRQIASVLAWEQGIVYTIALALGILFGALMVITVVPALAFSNPTPPGSVISSTEFYVIQHVLPTQIVLSITLALAFAILLVICAAALVLMARMVSRPALSQTLRLNED